MKSGMHFQPLTLLIISEGYLLLVALATIFLASIQLFYLENRKYHNSKDPSNVNSCKVTSKGAKMTLTTMGKRQYNFYQLFQNTLGNISSVTH